MVEHLTVEYLIHNSKLNTVELIIRFGGWLNRNAEYEYYFHKSKMKDIIKISKKYLKDSKLDIEGGCNGFGIGSITYKYWDVKDIKPNLNELKNDVQDYINKL